MPDRVKKTTRRPKKRRTWCGTVSKKTIADDSNISCINVEDDSSTSTGKVPKLSVESEVVEADIVEESTISSKKVEEIHVHHSKGTKWL